MVEEAFAQEGTFPLDNVSYNLVCLIYEKSKGMEALDRYLRDAQGEPELVALFHRIRNQEGVFVRELQKLLVERIMMAKTTSSGLLVGAET